MNLIYSILLSLIFISTSSFAKEWNIMVFINGDNNLSSYAAKDLQEMIKAGGGSHYFDVNVMMDQSKVGDSRYIHLGDDGAVDTTINKGEIDSGDYKEVIKFVDWAATKSPAKNYMLIIWNHGSGWNKAQHIEKGISYDDNSGNHITTAQIGTMISKMPVKINILGYDACLMQMIEVVYETRNMVDFVVGSEETEPGDGWDYYTWLSNRGGFNAEQLAKGAAESYMASYPQDSVTLSVIDSLKFNYFLDVFNDWANKVSPSIYKIARDQATKYAYPDNKDLGQIIKASKNREVMNAYYDMFVAVGANGTMTKSTGLAIYAPSSRVDSNYMSLSFTKDFPAWIKLVKAGL